MKDKKLVKVFKSFVYRFQSSTGHYTQIVWGETTKIGCGSATYKSGRFIKKYVVCNYGKAGNLLRAPMYEVGRPCSSCPSGTSCSRSYPGLCQAPVNNGPFPTPPAGTTPRPPNRPPPPSPQRPTNLPPVGEPFNPFDPKPRPPSFPPRPQAEGGFTPMIFDDTNNNIEPLTPSSISPSATPTSPDISFGFRPMGGNSGNDVESFQPSQSIPAPVVPPSPTPTQAQLQPGGGNFIFFSRPSQTRPLVNTNLGPVRRPRPPVFRPPPMPAMPSFSSMTRPFSNMFNRFFGFFSG